MSTRAGQHHQARRNGHNASSRQRAGTAKRSLLPALDVPNSALYDDHAVIKAQGPESPTLLLPVDPVTRRHIIDSIDDFILQLPLGTDAAAAQVEATVSAKLLSLYLCQWQLKQRLTKWTTVAQELQELVQQQQTEMQQTQQQLQQTQQLHVQPQQTTPPPIAGPEAPTPAYFSKAADAELRQQLTATTVRLQEVEAAMKQLLSQQSLGSSLQSAQLLAERNAATTALSEATKATTAAQQEAARLRHALLDAEIDTQRSTVDAEAAQRRAADLEAELSRARSHIAAAMSDADAERRKLAAAEAATATSHAQLLEAQAAASRAQLEATKAQQQAEEKVSALQLQCAGCADKAGKVLALHEELQGLQTSRTTLELALQEEQKYSKDTTKRLEECRMDLERARVASAQAEQQRSDLYAQLYGSDLQGRWAATATDEPYPTRGDIVVGSSPQKAYVVDGMSHIYGSCGSPTRARLLQWRQHPGEGVLHRCGQMQLQLQQQGTEVKSLREQLLELQLQLSDAQSASNIAQQQLHDTRSKLAAAEAAAAQASAEAASAVKLSQEQQLQLTKLQLQGPELAAARRQVDKLEAQQQLLLGDVKDAISAAADASAAQASAAAKAESLQLQLQEFKLKHESANVAWLQEKSGLTDQLAECTARLAAAESAAQAGLQQAAAHHQEQLGQLTAGHTACIDALREELAADAARRAEAEDRLQVTLDSAWLQALQQQHSQQLDAVKAEMQQQVTQQQSLNQTVATQKAELAGAAQKLAAAEAELAAARTEAAAQRAAAITEQDRLRQQLLEIRGDRLQLQEQLSLLQRSSGSSQLLADQLAAAQKDAAGLRQQLLQQQQRGEQLQQQVQQLQQDKCMLESRFVEARAGKEAAAKQAAAAGERLATAVAAQEALRQQLEILVPEPGRHLAPAIGSPYRSQVTSSHRPAGLTLHLANTEAQLAAMGVELQQAQQDKLALVQELECLQGKLADSESQRTCDSRAAQTSPTKPFQGAAQAHSRVPRLRSALQDLMQLTETMETLELRLSHQAATSGSRYTDPPSSNSAREGSSHPSCYSTAGGHSSSRQIEVLHLSSAAAAVADLHREMRRVSRELRAQEEQQQQQLAECEGSAAERDAQQVLALRQLVQQLSADLSDKEALVAELPALQKQLVQLSQQLMQREEEAADAIGLRRQVEDLRIQLAAARSAGDTNSSTAQVLQQLLAEMADLKAQLDAARQQHDDTQASATAAAAAEAAVAAAAAAAEAEQLQGLVAELQVHLTSAHAEAAACSEARDKVAAELRFLQDQFEDVTAELQQKQQQLEAQQAQVTDLEQQLSALEAAASTAQAAEQQLKLKMLSAQEAEALERSDVETAQQQLLRLQTELEQLHNQLRQQRQQAAAASEEEPTSTAHKMQTLLQRDHDVKKLQQLLHNQALQIQQLQQAQRQQEAGEQLAGEQLAGEQLAGEQLAGEQLAGEQLAGEQLAGEQLAGDSLQASGEEARGVKVMLGAGNASGSSSAGQQQAEGQQRVHTSHIGYSLQNTASRSSSRGKSESAAGCSSDAGRPLVESHRLVTSSSFGAAVARRSSVHSRRSSSGQDVDHAPSMPAAVRTSLEMLNQIQPGEGLDKQQQRLDRSPSRRAAAVAAAAVGGVIGSRELLRLPNGGNVNSCTAQDVQLTAAMAAGSRLASFRGSDTNISSTNEDPLRRIGPTPARLSHAESMPVMSRQVSGSGCSRAAQIAGGIDSDSMRTSAAAAAGLMSSSDDESDDGVGALGGLTHSNSSSRRVSSGSVKVSGQRSRDNGTDGSRMFAGDAALPGVGSFSSSVDNIRRSLSGGGDRGVSTAASSSSTDGSSRAKLLADSLISSGGYDVEKLQRSLSAGRRQAERQQARPASAMQRTRHASESGALAGSSTIAAAGFDRLIAGAGLKPALSTSRAARIAGVMRSVSFREPSRQ